MKKTIKHALSVCLILLSFVLIFTSCGQMGIKLPDSEGLAYSVNEDGISCTITGIGNCTDTKIGIPETIDGYTVTGIGDQAFAYCTAITSITIPDGVTNIGDYAFYDCASLTSITIPDSVTSISDGAFDDCTSLESITIPDSVTSISDGAFEGCASLESITVENGNPVYHSSGNCIIETERKELVLGCSTSVIPEDGSVEVIGERAFYGCKALTSITIPDCVTSIGDHAFASCESLTSITIPDGVTSIGNDAFVGCTSLTSIDIPDSVTSIGYGAFRGCQSLTSITIPESVTSIDNSVFIVCTSLTSITIPDSVTSIGNYAFCDCMSLTSINYSGTIEQWNAIDKSSSWNYNTGDYVVHCTDGDISK